MAYAVRMTTFFSAAQTSCARRDGRPADAVAGGLTVAYIFPTKKIMGAQVLII